MSDSQDRLMILKIRPEPSTKSICFLKCQKTLDEAKLALPENNTFRQFTL